MSGHSSPSWFRNLCTGAWFYLCRVWYASDERWKQWLPDHAPFAHVPPDRVMDWYEFFRERRGKAKTWERLGALAVFGVCAILHFALPVRFAWITATFASSFVLIFVAIVLTRASWTFGHVYEDMRMLAATYVSGEKHRFGCCLKCGYNLTGVASDACPECGSTRFVEEIIRRDPPLILTSSPWAPPPSDTSTESPAPDRRR